MPAPEAFDHNSMLKTMRQNERRNAELKRRLKDAGFDADNIKLSGDFGFIRSHTFISLSLFVWCSAIDRCFGGFRKHEP